MLTGKMHLLQALPGESEEPLRWSWQNAEHLLW